MDDHRLQTIADLAAVVGAIGAETASHAPEGYWQKDPGQTFLTSDLHAVVGPPTWRWIPDPGGARLATSHAPPAVGSRSSVRASR